MIDWLLHGGRYLVGGLTLAAALLASAHAVMRKREPRAAVLWVVVIWFVPFVGPLLYTLLGINRIKRRAIVRQRESRRTVVNVWEEASSLESRKACAPPEPLKSLARLVDGLVPRSLTPGNLIEPLLHVEQAYTAMLAAIDGAHKSVALASYIFEHHGIGQRFVEALERAVTRGVEVRVLLDDTHARFSWRSAARALRRARVPVGVFNPKVVPSRFHAIQLRNHAKILIADGHLGFTGGLNIAADYWPSDARETCKRDLHFRLRGPVVAHLAEVFAADWHFATEEVLAGENWFPPLDSCGDALTRGIESGPDENFERLRWTIHGALAVARNSVRIITPYFLPDPALIAALNVAAMRGVEVDIILPAHTDLPFVDWAMQAQLWQVIERGCRVWFQPGPFDHSKLLLVDNAWALFGSMNWDERSLRLNFEFNVECYSTSLGAQLAAFAESRRAASRRITFADVNSRKWPVKLRDGMARLFAPFL